MIVHSSSAGLGRRADAIRGLSRWLAGVVAVAAAIGAQAGQITSTETAKLLEPLRGYGEYGGSVTFPILPKIGGSASIGGFVGGVGASISGGATFGIQGGLFAGLTLSQFDFAYPAKFTTTISWTGEKLAPGASFRIGAAATPLAGSVLHVNSNSFRAKFNLLEEFAIEGSAKGCLGGCAWFHAKLSGVLEQEVVGINTLGTGELRVLDQTVGKLPKTWATQNGEIKVTASLPNFSGTLKSTPAGSSFSYASKQNLAVATVDIAQILAEIAGLPIPLSGSLVGFDYTVLAATIGLGLDVRHSLVVTPKQLQTVLSFSSPVQVFDAVTGQWGKPVTSALLPAGQEIDVRTASPAKTLGIVPLHRLAYGFDADWGLVPFVSAGVRALELSGYGLDFGPMIEKSVSKSFGIIPYLSDTLNDQTDYATGKPLTLAFDPITVTADGVTDLCAVQICADTIFVPVLGAPDAEGWSTGEIRRVMELADACLQDVALCLFDPDFLAMPASFRPASRTAGAQDEVTGDLATLLRILGQPDLEGGPDSDEAFIRRTLLALGYDPDNPAIPSLIRRGLPFPTEPLADDIAFDFNFSVPAPSMISLFGFALVVLAACRASASPFAARADTAV